MFSGTSQTGKPNPSNARTAIKVGNQLMQSKTHIKIIFMSCWGQKFGRFLRLQRCNSLITKGKTQNRIETSFLASHFFAGVNRHLTSFCKKGEIVRFWPETTGALFSSDPVFRVKMQAKTLNLEIAPVDLCMHRA